MERDPEATGPLIRGFAGRGYRVDDRVHDGGMLLTPERAIDWVAPAVDLLTMADMEGALALSPLPEFILLGTGAQLARPPVDLVLALEALGVGIEAMDSRAAARAWGLLRAEQRWIAALLYPLS
ncbi:MTH938/NDUFAF3 family protein [Sphingomonas montana]|uniref:MTH938/NDUFAF3 family protein n=1 Tax=Sphingomonas montana TaxID=1843236 RepID=UPI001F0AE0FB|nr:MTH938/NDUFAF3 family protein [Sphingomonas montana]